MTANGFLPASSLAHFCESAGLMAMKQVSSLIGRPATPLDGLLPIPPSSSLMNLAAASMVAAYSGKLPAGSPCGFWTPITTGSPAALMGLTGPHWMSAVYCPAFLPLTASMDGSGSHGFETPACPGFVVGDPTVVVAPPGAAVVVAPVAAVVVAPPAVVV